MNAPTPRVDPVAPPYPPELHKVFDAIMRPGVPPLTLFTTLARVPRIWDRFRAGSLLDPGPVSLRHREIVIDRTCARCGCGYEWGVHVTLFAQRAALTPEQVRATVQGDADDPAWTDDERLLIRMVDELHDASTLSDDTWSRLAASFSVEQILELIALASTTRSRSSRTASSWRRSREAHRFLRRSSQVRRWRSRTPRSPRPSTARRRNAWRRVSRA